MNAAQRLFLFSYLILIIVVFILPNFSHEGYSILKNTTSELGAQNTPYAWIMNLVFIAMGLFSIILVWPQLKYFLLPKGLIILFGLSLAMTGIFSHAPINNSIEYSILEDTIHSVFATITGFAFTFFAITIGFIENDKNRKILAFAIAILATVLSIMMSEFEAFRGILQRIIFITSFGWLLYEVRGRGYFSIEKKT